MRTNILCAGKVLGAAIGVAGNVSYSERPSRFDRLATLAETEAHCAEFNARGYGQPIYAKPAEDCRYNDPA
jgi:hypothetical protein